MDTSTPSPWFYFVPFEQDTNHDHCGTGGYFPNLNAAIKYADKLESRRVKGRKRLLPCMILNVHHEVIKEVGITFTLRRIRLNQGGYDSDGHYWGIGYTLYHFDDGGSMLGHVRALDREDAKRKIRVVHPLAQFYR